MFRPQLRVRFSDLFIYFNTIRFLKGYSCFENGCSLYICLAKSAHVIL